MIATDRRERAETVFFRTFRRRRGLDPVKHDGAVQDPPLAVSLFEPIDIAPFHIKLLHHPFGIGLPLKCGKIALNSGAARFEFDQNIVDLMHIALSIFQRS